MEQAAQKVREERISIVDDVRQNYYSIVEIQNAIEATQASIQQYQELDRITLQYVNEKVALESENLEVKARLAQEQYKLLQYEDKLQSAKELLNNLLGRDINTRFRAVNVTELSPTEEDLTSAQATALAQNPEVKEAEITVKQADNARPGEVTIYSRSRCIVSLSLAFWRELCSNQHHGAWSRIHLGALRLEAPQARCQREDDQGGAEQAQPR